MSYEPPLTIVITTPSLIAPGLGVNSTGKRGGNLRVRCTNREYDAIQQEAMHLNLSLAMFCRSCIVKAAQRLKAHRDNASLNMTAQEEDGDIGPGNSQC